MSILIRGMEMPNSCAECKPEWRSSLVSKEGARCYCRIAKQYGSLEIANQRRMDFCPLVEVPTPRGRLIDADKLHKDTYHRAFETGDDTMWQSGCWVRYRAIEQVQVSQPTIIEAEG
jgi:hypothetical protein